MNINVSKEPTAYITVGKNRQRIHQKQFIYLDDGTEFEIELFNPTTKTVLAKIQINNRDISNSGIVLYPGKREYLDRFIDSPEKFKFTTYTVEESIAAKEAIKNNGFIKVDFYFEKEYTNPYDSIKINDYDWRLNFTGSPVPPQVYYTTNGTFSNNTNLLDNVSTDTVNINMSDSNIEFTYTSNLLNETGIIEKGSKSDTKFETVNKDFESWSSSTIEYRILPKSTKPIEVNEIKVYCTNCGLKRRNNNWKFCPKCGTKY